MNDKWRLSEDAQLSIDFIIGFTIFMIAFIFVATMMSGLLVNLQSQTIDYDAVAYRTGVMLTEDPGNPYNPDDKLYWNLLDLTTHRDEVERLGLSIGRNSPAILQQAKVERFFRWEPSDDENKDVLYYPDDYRQKLIFGDYPYNFNISLKEIDGDDPWSVGPEPPANRPYGYARRAVLIKKPSVAQIEAIQDDATSEGINITTNIYDLVYPPAEIKPAHQVDIFQEDLIINVTGFTKDTLLQSISWFPSGSLVIPTESPTILVNEVPYQEYEKTTNLKNKNLEIRIEQGYFTFEKLSTLSEPDIELRLQFNQSVSKGYTLVLDEIAHPPLSPAVLEVKVW